MDHNAGKVLYERGGENGLLAGPGVITHPFKGLKNVEEAQIIQKELDHVTVRMVPLDGDIRDTSSIREAAA